VLCKPCTDRGLVHSVNEEFSMPRIFITDKPIFLSERMLHKDYDCKGSVENSLVVSLKGLGRQGELIGGKPPV
jgi:hypothetical protein